MSQSEYDVRFGGIKRLYGVQASDVLRNSHVAVAGIGGVGTWIVEALARSGIGKITLIDLDDICSTNVNRQIHAMTGTVGQPKVDVMAERVNAINPECDVNVIEDFITVENLRDIITTEFDYMVDAIDGVKAKAAMIAHCKRNKIPIITTGGAGGQTDPTQITMGDVARTIQDPLMKKVRNTLRREYGFSKNPKRKFGVDCVYSTEQLVYPSADGAVCHQKSNNDGAMRLDCNLGFGAATMVTGTFGFFVAAHVVKKLIAKNKK
ncbi:tRNA cyclic N6-threonylcarbamoyladenosine(37) synthase TcdA [Flocculibacter collagenilyticus]|uniref:tRNA cyclic N6-threonylcarbamoyladenosine(37) synthase TcdA n=1 Tax=Flocculibacter collagenilyticus TaxID=2744479 RepID=UPI0018F546E0|nr:tRNA cyclic N6-threonylcarbamoyladenosine(37) synthase TcdA [Flocculibacter collagenilyticus]